MMVFSKFVVVGGIANAAKPTSFLRRHTTDYNDLQMKELDEACRPGTIFGSSKSVKPDINEMSLYAALCSRAYDSTLSDGWSNYVLAYGNYAQSKKKHGHGYNSVCHRLSEVIAQSPVRCSTEMAEKIRRAFWVACQVGGNIIADQFDGHFYAVEPKFAACDHSTDSWMLRSNSTWSDWNYRRCDSSKYASMDSDYCRDILSGEEPRPPAEKKKNN